MEYYLIDISSYHFTSAVTSTMISSVFLLQARVYFC